MTPKPAKPAALPVPSPHASETVIAYPAAGVPGPPGERGPAGDAAVGPVMWTGQGTPPDLLPGAKPGDRWFDETSGTIWVLH